MADKDFRAIIKAQLDTKSIQGEIDEIGKKYGIEFKRISFDKSSLINSIQSVLDGHKFNISLGNLNVSQLTSQTQQIGNTIGQQLTRSINSNLSHIQVDHNIQQIFNMQKALKSMRMNDTDIAKVTQDLLSMDVAVESIKTHLNKQGGINITVRGVDELHNVVNIFRSVTKETEQMSDGTKQTKFIIHDLGTTVIQNFAQQEKQISKNNAEIIKYKANIESAYKKAIDPNATKPITNQTDLQSLENEYHKVIGVINNLKNADSQTFVELEAEIDAAITKFNAYVTVLQRANTTATDWRSRDITAIKNDQVERLRAFNAEIAKSGIPLSAFKTDIEGLSTLLNNVSDPKSLRAYLDELSKGKNEFRALRQEAAQYVSAADVNILKGKMETWLNKNTKAAGTYGNTVRNLINDLASQGKVVEPEFKRISDAFKEVDAAASAAGMKGRSFFQSILGAAKSLTRYFGVSTFIYRTFAAVKEGITNIIDLDTALVDLRKTTDGTVEQLNNFYYSANGTAKNLGVTTQEVIQATAEWSRLGYSLKDAEIMAEVSAKFKAISPGVDMEKAQDGLVSAMKAFNISADEALDGIASKINAIGNSQAVSNADIIEFLTRSSSAMKEANNTLEETIALGTAA